LARDPTGDSAARAATCVINPTRSGPLGALFRHARDADRRVPGRVAEPGAIVARQVSARDLLRPEIGRDDQAATFDEGARLSDRQPERPGLTPPRKLRQPLFQQLVGVIAPHDSFGHVVEHDRAARGRVLRHEAQGTHGCRSPRRG